MKGKMNDYDTVNLDPAMHDAEFVLQQEAGFAL
jgi:hypothetical protein